MCNNEEIYYSPNPKRAREKYRRLMELDENKPITEGMIDDWAVDFVAVKMNTDRITTKGWLLDNKDCFSKFGLAVDTSPILFAKLMFENTDEDSNLLLKNWYDVVKDDCESYIDVSCNIKWEKEDVDDLIETYKDLHRELRIISRHLDELDEIHLAQENPYIESSNGILENQHLEATYFIFLAPFKAKNENQLQGQIIGRVGEELYGYEMILHARRLCKLMQLKAPEKVIFNEGRMLIAAMAIHHFGTKIVKQLRHF